jgi:hypothetical protein
MKRLVATLLLTALALGVSAEAQFRRGMFGEAAEITLFPIDPPVLLLPAGSITVSVRNSTAASARIVERLRDLLQQQLTDNDPRLRTVESGGDITIVATLTEWTESRRNSTKYVSERRQIGTREVIDKSGKKRTEPVYEYGRNKPSVVINAAAGVRLEVRPRAGEVLADETARHTIAEEHLTEAGPPTRDAVEDMLIDNVVRTAAGRVSPGRQPIRAMLARSDEVDRLNALAQNRKWQDWLAALALLKPHRDRKRDAYRLHNLAVAHESLAYDATATEDTMVQLAQATKLITQARAQHPDEKYIDESAQRIVQSTSAYRQLAALQQVAHAARPLVPPPTPAAIAATATTGAPATLATDAPMTNQDIVDLRAAGLDDDNLIAAVKAANAVAFDLSPAGLKALLAGKVSNRVISAMRARQ